MGSPTTPETTPRQVDAQRIVIRPLRRDDLPLADRIVRDAFDTFTGVPNLFGTRSYVETRWKANPHGALAAELNGQLVGSNFVTGWGAFGFFGPLSVRPDLWDQGVAKALMGPTLEVFETLGTRRQALFTFPSSPKHIGLYQKFGFWPRYLAPVLSKPIAPEEGNFRATRYSQLPPAERETYAEAARELTGSLFEGLDLEREIRSVDEQGIGDTVFLDSGGRLNGLAVCHVGAGSEAGGENCYIKFGMVRAAPDARREFERLLRTCAGMGARRGAARMEVGVSTACRGPYETLLALGYRAGMIGVTMERPDGITYHRDEAWVVSDWR